MVRFNNYFIMLVLLVVVSCVSFSKNDRIKVAGMSHTGVGELIITVGEELQKLYDMGNMKHETFVKYQTVYNSLIPLYIKAGDLQLVLFKFDDDSEDYVNINSKYLNMMGSIKSVLLELVQVLHSYDVKI